MTQAEWMLLVRTRRADDDDGDLLAQLERTEEARRLVREFRSEARTAALPKQEPEGREEQHG